jgi:feruloyl-CoA synthase
MHEGAPYVQDAVVTGHDRADIGLLIIPNLAQCRIAVRPGADAAPQRGAGVRPGARLVPGPGRPAVPAGHRQRQPRGARVAAAEPPSIDRGEITDKGSINQRAVLSHRCALVEQLYAGLPS